MSVRTRPHIPVSDDRLVEAIADLTTQHGYPPTIREIADTVGIRSSSSVHSRLLSLRQKGRVEWNPKSPRTLRVLAIPA